MRVKRVRHRKQEAGGEAVTSPESAERLSLTADSNHPRTDTTRHGLMCFTVSELYMCLS